MTKYTIKFKNEGATHEVELTGEEQVVIEMFAGMFPDGEILEVTEVAAEQTERTPAPKTSGIFKVVNENDEEFSYVGASTQLEIAFRDYMNWINKNKAPKAIQAMADRLIEGGMDVEEAIKSFSYQVLEECAKGEFKTKKKIWMGEEVVEEIPEAQPEAQPEPEQADAPDNTEDRNSAILARLAEGSTPAQVAEEFGVSKSTVYNIKRNS